MIAAIVNILKKLGDLCWLVLNGNKTPCHSIKGRKAGGAELASSLYLERQHPPKRLGFENPNPDWEKPPPFAWITA